MRSKAGNYKMRRGGLSLELAMLKMPEKMSQ